MKARNLLIAAAVAIPAQRASAQRADISGMYAAANNYRNAVVLFEKVAKNVRGIERTDERLIDKLEEATRGLRAASRNTRATSRLRREWSEIQTLQYRVEVAIFVPAPWTVALATVN